jgi:hypothetical protein
MKMCPCGKPLHYSDLVLEETVSQLVAIHGEYVPVTVGNKTYKVSRHFIALHGIKAQEIDKLGFEVIKSY